MLLFSVLEKMAWCSVESKTVVHVGFQGHQTGYPFHDALVRKIEKHDRVNAEVEVPPTLTAVALHDDEWFVEVIFSERVLVKLVSFKVCFIIAQFYRVRN